MGTSLGVRGLTWSAGMLGGYVGLYRGQDAPIVCALSCHHVLRPSKGSSSGSSNATTTTTTTTMTTMMMTSALEPLYNLSLDEEGRYQPAVEAKDPSLRMEAPSTKETAFGQA